MAKLYYRHFVEDIYNGLSDEQIMNACPAIFATSAYEDCSATYGFAQTSQVLEGLRGEGFVPITAMQSDSRKEGKAAFTKHLLQFCKQEDLGSTRPDKQTMVLVNAHDLTSSYQVMMGIVRMICRNNLIAGDFNHDIRIRHNANAFDKVIDSTLTIIEEGRGVMEQVEAMKGIELNREEQLLLAKCAMSARFDLKMEDGEIVDEKMNKLPYTPADFLWSHRREDQGKDLWTTTNVLQERIIRGGVSRRDWEGKRKTTKEIKDIGTNIHLNKMLWQMAVGMQKIKQG